MKIKKTIAGIAALSVIISSGAFTALTASAAETSDYTTSKMTAHVYSDENLIDIECRYYSDMPHVPYIKLSDYYSCWTGQELEITAKNDGTYEVKVPYGATGIIDINKDYMSSEDMAHFIFPAYVFEDDNHSYETYTKEIMTESEPMFGDIDFSEYKIDIRGDENEAWWPAATLCDIFEYPLNEGMCVEEELYFCGHVNSEYNRKDNALNPAHAAEYLEKYKDGRPKDMAEFNYNELCFEIDNNYGFPGRIKYNDLLAEKGFDGMLSEASDGTRKVKEMLLSEDPYEYCAGLELLNHYFWDGGHTFFNNLAAIGSQEQVEKVGEYLISPYELEGAFIWWADNASSNASGFLAQEARMAMFETADTYEAPPHPDDTHPYYEYAVKGDTAFFSFNGFNANTPAWLNYYYNNGELPKDLISDFYSCITRADKDPAIKNFVIDLGTNRGGSVDVMEYMMGLISGLDHITLASGDSGEPQQSRFLVDKNLDKVFDEKDNAFKTDLRFGIITSYYSFSCANFMPSLAKDNGIMLIGERSGGGTCSTDYYATADGMIYAMSYGIKFADKDGNSIDEGIEPDYALVKINEDGLKDYSDVYNFANLSSLFADFYKKNAPQEPSEPETETTTTTTTVTNTETTTTTTVSTTSDKDSTTSATSSASGSSSETTTTTDASDLPKTGNNSMGTAAAAACAFIMTLSGGAAMMAAYRLRRKDENGSL